MNKKVLEALNTLKEYPELENYIRTFNGKDGFMFTEETHPQRIEWRQRILVLLDDGWHSGASFAFMMRIIQGVLCGTITREELFTEEEE
jgi:hypothetical protein